MLAPGAQIGHYHLEAEIGRGGMGVVYRAFDPGLQRRVALKVIAPHIASELPALARFRREAATTARLHHPNIAAAYEAGEHDGQPYIVFEWIEGEPLSALIDRAGRLPLDRALRLFDQLASALDYAHAHGVLHRDLKPDNILVTPDDQPVIIDFGLAWLATQTALTATGAFFGTPRYMAPEQFLGHNLDGRADLYSLAIVLYEMLASRPPFSDESIHALYHKHLFVEPPAISDFTPDLPTAVAYTLAQALAKRPEDRFPTGADFSVALRAPVPPNGLPPRRPLDPNALAQWLPPSVATDTQAPTQKLPLPVPDVPTPALAGGLSRLRWEWGALGLAIILFVAVVAFGVSRLSTQGSAAPPTRVVVVVTSAPSPSTVSFSVIGDPTPTPATSPTQMIPVTGGTSTAVTATPTETSVNQPAALPSAAANTPTLVAEAASPPTSAPSAQATSTEPGPTPTPARADPSATAPSSGATPTATHATVTPSATTTAMATPSQTPTLTRTRTSTLSPTSTFTLTPAPTDTATPTATAISTPTPTPTALAGCTLNGGALMVNGPELQWEVQNYGTASVIVTALDFNWPDLPVSQKLIAVRFGDSQIASDDDQRPPSVFPTEINWVGIVADRELGPDSSRTLSFLFAREPLLPTGYSVVAAFDNGCTLTAAN